MTEAWPAATSRAQHYPTIPQQLSSCQGNTCKQPSLWSAVWPAAGKKTCHALLPQLPLLQNAVAMLWPGKRCKRSHAFCCLAKKHADPSKNSGAAGNATPSWQQRERCKATLQRYADDTRTRQGNGAACPNRSPWLGRSFQNAW